MAIEIENQEEQKNDKLSSLGSAIMVGSSMLKQLNGDRENYTTAFEKQQESILDPRIKALHSVSYNINLNSYEQQIKEVTKLLSTYKEELEHETGFHTNSNSEAKEEK
jgi:hypothetical protein